MPDIYPLITEFIENRIKEFDTIPKERKSILNEIASYIFSKKEQKEESKLIFICTHNSRRSHFAQIWLEIACNYYDIDDVYSFSGGTEATALNPRVIKALKSIGLKINSFEENSNPQYYIRYSDDIEHIVAFSKEYSDDANPSEKFAAVMVCSDAEEACPFIIGADKRYYLPYNDPKHYDETSDEEQGYMESNRKIAKEMLYIVNNVSQAEFSSKS